MTRAKCLTSSSSAAAEQSSAAPQAGANRRGVAELRNAVLTTPAPVAASPEHVRAWLRFARNVGIVLFLVAVFGAVEHDPLYANSAISTMSEKEIRDLFIEQMERGNALRQVALLAFGCVGVVGLVSSRGKPWTRLPMSVVVPIHRGSPAKSRSPFAGSSTPASMVQAPAAWR